MDISVRSNPGRKAVHSKVQVYAERAEKQENASFIDYKEDTVEISTIGRKFMEKAKNVDSAGSTGEISGEESVGEVTSFPTFAEAFANIAKVHMETVRACYAEANKENLSYCSPKEHVWDKYKNPDSSCFRYCMTRDERAWAYDQEMDFLNGGKHLRLNDPYAWPEGELPTLTSVTAQANQICRTQIDEAIGRLFAEKGLEITKDAAFRLTVDPKDDTIHAVGLEDETLTATIEEALNHGKNGRNLYAHLKLTCPDSDSLGIEYTAGHLAALETTKELDAVALAEVRKQAGPLWTRYAETYTPHQEAICDHILNLDPDMAGTQEQMDHLSSAIRIGALDAITRFRTQMAAMSLIPQKIDSDDPVLEKEYTSLNDALPEKAEELVQSYYADAHEENSALSLPDALNRILEKYKRSASELFRRDLPEAQRDMAYRQERALLFGSNLTLWDPYAITSVEELVRQIEAQAAQERFDRL